MKSVNEQEKREKAIEGLECCKDIHTAGLWAQGCVSCPYAETPSDGANGKPCIRRLFDDALALLKEQEPHVVTLAELYEWPGERPIYVETVLNEYNWAIFHCHTSIATYFSVFEGGDTKKRIYSHEKYNKFWRCWATEPTDEQRIAMTWEHEK